MILSRSKSKCNYKRTEDMSDVGILIYFKNTNGKVT